MSKIETALAKAGKGRVVQLDSVGRGKPGTTELVPVRQERSLVNRQQQMASAATALKRMNEPWLLDAKALGDRRLIHMEMVDTDVAMAFRDLRTKVLQVAQENCTVAVTTCAKGYDSCLVAANLAVSFSLDDCKTAMLLDCNLNGSSSLERLTGVAGEYGLTDYLRNNDVSLDQIIHAIGLQRFRLIPKGKSHDQMAEYFTLAKMRELLEELRARHIDRYIVLNAPPIVESADARVLAELADYVILVVPYGRVTEGQIAQAVKMIEDKKLLGVVFSDMPWLPSGHRGVFGWLARLSGFGHKRSRAKRKK